MFAPLVAAVLSAAPAPSEIIIGGALGEGGAMARVTDLTDRVGARLSGSPGAAAAVRWAVEQFRAAGVNVRTEAVKVPVWVRGEERGEVLAAPGRHAWPLALTALGGSPPTPSGGLEAEVVEVTSLQELETAPVQGRIVYFHHQMALANEYLAASELRTVGPAKAARRGAVGTLVRSAATASFRSPHTGWVRFRPGEQAIPAAAISTEDASVLHRWLAQGPVRVRLILGCRIEPDADSANVVAEIKGRERPAEVVLLGAHLDSWDLSVSAQDDGAGVAIVLDSARLLARVRPAPRRTVRFVLFMNEENGAAGATGYAAAHRGELHAAALEADMGAGRPLRIDVRAADGAEAFLAPLVRPLGVIGVSAVVRSEHHGADLGPLARARGLATVSVSQETTHYFDIHHSAADTMEKIDPASLGQAAAAWAWMTWALADAQGALPPPPLEAPPKD